MILRVLTVLGVAACGLGIAPCDEDGGDSELEELPPVCPAVASRQSPARFGPEAPLAGGWRIDAQGRLDLLPVLASLIDEADAERGAAVFHATLVAALGEWLQQAAIRTGVTTVAFGGGCFFNALLRDGLRRHAHAAGLKVLEAGELMPGDTAIAFGQAWIARQRFS